MWEKLSKTCLQLLHKTTKKADNPIKCYKEQINTTKYVEEKAHNEKNKKPIEEIIEKNDKIYQRNEKNMK